MQPTERDERTRAPRPVVAPRPAPLGTAALRRHRALLALLVLVGLVRGLFWVGLVEVWNPIDEAAHFAYVESLATGRGIPVVGEDIVSRQVIEVAKESPTYFARSRPFKADPSDEYWGATRHQYEGIQGPTAYAALVPFYWLGRPFGFVAAVYAVRVGTLLMALAAVPLAWLLARQLLPNRPAAWLLAPTVLVAVNGFNANLASITNDALLTVASAAATVVFLRLRWRSHPGDAAVAGVLFGLAVVTKTTALALVPFLGVVFLWIAATRRHPPAALARWAVAFAVAAALAVAPWLGFNLVTYGAVSASTAVEELTGSIQSRTNLDADGVAQQLEGLRLGFWELQPRTSHALAYAQVLEAATVLLVLAAVVGATARGRPAEARAVAWSAFGIPSAMIVLLVIVYGVFGGVGTAVGRHAYAALVPAAAVLGVAAVVAFGSRGGTVAVAALLVVATTVEQDVIDNYVERAYLQGIVDGRAPVVEQSFADDEVTVRGFTLDAPCPVDLIGMFSATPPTNVLVDAGGRTARARPAGRDGGFSLYRLPEPVTGRAAIRLPSRPFMTVSLPDRDPRLALIGREGDPVARAYCRVEDPASVRFEQLHDVQHPDAPYTATGVGAWASGWAWAARLGLLVALVRLATRFVRR